MASRLRNALLLVHDIGGSLALFRDGLGLSVVAASDTYAELKCKSSASNEIALKKIDTETVWSGGKSPLILNFEVEDMDTTLPKMLSMGATLDGPVQHHIDFKMAAVRTPDGHNIGLIQFDRFRFPAN